LLLFGTELCSRHGSLNKVHRVIILQKEPSVFSDMFSLQTVDAIAEGFSDEKPLVLSGDTTEEFRALCWIMYAL
jgi:hypothetical protein